MGGLFSKPKAPPPPSPAVEQSLTAQEKAVESENQRQKSITATMASKKKGGLMGLMMSGGTRPDYGENTLKNKLGGGVRNPRNLL
tara:strand:- start:1125 stop:1379 length:255 start_codon:yes stop_codon:yes gene_type:complete